MPSTPHPGDVTYVIVVELYKVLRGFVEIFAMTMIGVHENSRITMFVAVTMWRCWWSLIGTTIFDKYRPSSCMTIISVVVILCTYDGS